MITAQNIFIVVITMNGFAMYKTVIYRIRIFTLCLFFVNNNSLMRNDKQEKSVKKSGTKRTDFTQIMK